MHQNGRTTANGTLQQAFPPAPPAGTIPVVSERPGNSGSKPWWIASLAGNLVLAACLVVIVWWLIPGMMEVTKESRQNREAAQKERLDREAALRREAEAAAVHRKLADDVRTREMILLADTIRQQEEAAKIARENLERVREMRELLRAKGE